MLTPDNWRARLVASYDYSPTLATHMERWLADHRGEVGLDWAQDVTRLQHYNDHLKPGGGGLYDKHLSDAPSSAGVEWDAGMYHFNVSGDLLAAKRHLGAAATLAPEVLTVHYHLGLIYHLLGAAERAEQSYRAAIAATTLGEEEFAARASYNVAAALLNTGRREEALTHLRRALELMPDYPQAQQALELLTNDSTLGVTRRLQDWLLRRQRERQHGGRGE